MNKLFKQTKARARICIVLLTAALAFASSLSLTGCASSLRSVGELKHKSAHAIYKTAKKAMRLRRYEDAVKYYELVGATHPFSPYAEQANLEMIYAYYKHDELPLGIAASTRYIHLYPRSPNVDYAYYMKGLLNFLTGITWTQRYLPLSMAQHDLDSMREGFNAFNELIHLFPNSRYAPDAHHRMLYIRNLLAKRELNIAEYYYKRRLDVAAVNRASNVVKHFSGTPHVLPALALMAKAYRRMGDSTLANRAQRIVDYNKKR